MTSQAEQIRRRAAAAAARKLQPQIDGEPPETVNTSQTTGGGVIAPVEASTARSVALPVLDLSREIDQSDIIMPRLAISQAMSKVNQSGTVPMGNWYHSTRQENLGPDVYVIPVSFWKHRSRFVQGVGVLCRSFDLINGEGDPGGLCEGDPDEMYTKPARLRGCPLRHWGERDPQTGQPSRPECGVNYNYGVLICREPDNLDDGETRRAVVTFRGTQIATGKAIITMKVEGDLDWTDMVLKLSVVKKTGPKGTYLVPMAEYVKASGGKNREKALAFAPLVNASVIRATTERSDLDD